MLDYIIVGQGIAGTLVSHYLLKANKNIVVVDNNFHQSSSKLAAGLVNPITGRRFVKSWRIDQLIPFAQSAYQELEQELGIKIMLQKNVTWILSSPKMENDWMQRSSELELAPYIVLKEERLQNTEAFQNARSVIEFKQAGQVQLLGLMKAYRQKLQNQDAYLQENFDYSQLQIDQDGVKYKHLKAKRIIFCEGYQAMENPFFNYLPFWPAKGEVILVRIPNYPHQNKLIKHDVFIIHLYDDIYWVGSSYIRKYETTEPTDIEQQQLAKRLASGLNLPFEIVDHQAAVRPTVRDRRPFLGQHPIHQSMYIFNGLGAKGSYLAPFFANYFVNYLEQGQPLDKEVDIQRNLNFFNQNK
ncbi:MAG: FAD-binding oxidoreductase [Aureispira sp.]|nr:FAD-binding oxidoreductase [Aureispira sp.]